MNFVKISEIISPSADKTIGLIDNFLNAGSVVNVLRTGNPLPALAKVGASIIYDLNERYTELSKYVGLDAPKGILDEAQAIDAERRFFDISKNPEIQNAYLTLKNQVNSQIQNIKEAHANFVNYSTGAYEVSLDRPSSVEAPGGSIEQSQKLHRELLTLCLEGLRLVQIFKDEFLERLRERLSEIQSEEGKIIGDQFITSKKIELQKVYTEIYNLYQEYYSFNEIIPNLQRKRWALNYLNAELPKYRTLLNVGMTVQSLMLMPGGLGEQLQLIVNEERAARDKIIKLINEMKTKLSGNIGKIELRQPFIKTYETSEELPESSEPEFSEFEDYYKFDNKTSANKSKLVFSIITERSNQVSTNKKAWYLNEINRAGSNLNYLYDYISDFNKEPNLSIEERTELLNLIHQKTYNHYKIKINEISTMPVSDPKRTSRALALSSYVADDKKIPDDMKKALDETLSKIASGQEKVEIPSFSSFASSVIPTTTLTEIRTDTETEATRPTPSDKIISDEKAQINAYRKVLEDELGNFTFISKIDDMTLAGGPQAIINNLTVQLNAIKTRINSLEAVFLELFMSPTSLSVGLDRIADLNQKFIKTASKFKKVDLNHEKKEILADQELEEYWNELLPGIGTALEHSPDYQGVKFKDLPVHKHKK